MRITHWAEFNEETRFWTLSDNENTVIATFYGYEQGAEYLKAFCQAMNICYAFTE